MTDDIYFGEAIARLAGDFSSEKGASTKLYVEGHEKYFLEISPTCLNGYDGAVVSIERYQEELHRGIPIDDAAFRFDAILFEVDRLSGSGMNIPEIESVRFTRGGVEVAVWRRNPKRGEFWKFDLSVV